MDTIQTTQRIVLTSDHIETWLEAFLVARKAARRSPGTLRFYQIKSRLLLHFLESQAVTTFEQLTPDILRRYLLWLEDTGHNAGGVHGCYRMVRAFLLWYEREVEPAGWRNPIKRVDAPSLPKELEEPLKIDVLRATLGTCKAGSALDLRDKAMFLALLDTGARAAEFLALDLVDIDLITGRVVIRQGKGNKARVVFMGSKARKAVRAYLRTRQDLHPALWLAVTGERLSYDGLRAMVARRAAAAGVPTPELHGFRRAFALGCIRGGMSIYQLKELMGHSSLATLQRYLKLTEEDLAMAHGQAGPVDRLL